MYQKAIRLPVFAGRMNADAVPGLLAGARYPDQIQQRRSRAAQLLAGGKTIPQR
jgi:hypothetical protein